MAIAKRHLRKSRVINPLNQDDSIRRERYFFETFMNAPTCTVQGSLTEPTLTALEKNKLFTGKYTFEWAVVGVDASAASNPTLGSEGGLNIVLAGSDVAGNGIELNFGSSLAGHPRNCTPRVTGGGGENWFLRALFIIDDVSGAEIVLGFKTAGAYVATLTEVVSIAGIRILGDDSSALAAFSIVSNLGSLSGTEYVSTAIATQLTDATVMEVEVRVIGGYAKYFINGAEVSPSSADQFELDQVVAPVIRATQQTDVAAQIKLLAAEGGPLEFRSTDTLVSLAGTTT